MRSPIDDITPRLTYPEGPYGKTVGSVIPNLEWEGYRDGTGERTKISLLDYYDPEGTRGINAIKVSAVALWCSTSRSEAARFTEIYPGLKERGARFLTVIIENTSRGPATMADVDRWMTMYGCNYDVVLDPTGKSLFPETGSIGLSYNLIVDPRTMKIVRIIQGDGPSVDIAVKSVLTTNGG